jgi:16S rRNA (guanine966-N2)-methyltransferase
LRPTPDALRERVFAVLGDRVDGARVLDLYAGTGVVGLEALSRGAREAVFVERHRSAIRLIESNRSSLGVDPGSASVLNLSARSALGRLAREARAFDLVWADPPFESWTEGLEILRAAFDRGVLTPEGTACLECPARAKVEDTLEGPLRIERDLGGGASRVVLLRWD